MTPSHLENFGGIGKYQPLEFTWRIPVGPTAIAFINSDKLGKQYQNDILVGTIHNGSIYRLNLNVKRNGFDLKGRLADKIADDVEESRDLIFGQGFGGITDIKIGPDGYVYVVIFSQESGKILKIVPKNEANQ